MQQPSSAETARHSAARTRGSAGYPSPPGASHRYLQRPNAFECLRLARLQLTVSPVFWLVRRPTFAEAKRVVRIMASVYAAEPAAAAQPPPPAMPAASSQAEQPALQAGQPSAAAQQPVLEPEEALPLPRLHRAAVAGDADKVCQATAASLQPGPPSMCLTLCRMHCMPLRL